MRLSDAEWTVMDVVWDQGQATAREVQELVAEQTGWAYTTTRTLLTRLVEKGALRESRRGNASLYEPRIDRTSARRSAVRSLLERAFRGSAASFLQHLVAEERLSAADRRRLRELLAEPPDAKGKGGSRG